MLGRSMMSVVRLSCLPLVLIELLVFLHLLSGAAGLGGIFVMVRGLVVSIMRARFAVI